MKKIKGIWSIINNQDVIEIMAQVNLNIEELDGFVTHII